MLTGRDINLLLELGFYLHYAAPNIPEYRLDIDHPLLQELHITVYVEDGGIVVWCADLMARDDYHKHATIAIDVYSENKLVALVNYLK